MKKEIVQMKKNRDGEKGAALVMVLLLSTLLLVASAGIILETTMNTANVTDSTAEQQAYNAAESGIQSAINVLRGNVVPSPLLDSSKLETHPNNLIDFRKAVSLSASNKTGESVTVARLSRWLNYNYSSTGGVNDRVVIGLDNPAAYKPLNGYAYSVTVTDPDNTGQIISFNTTGGIYDPRDNQWKSSITYGSSPNTVNITYTSNAENNLNVSTGSVNTDFGNFQVEASGTGATIPELRFQIILNMTAPYTATKVLRGTITGGNITSNSDSDIKYNFDSQYFNLMGSTIQLDYDTFPNSGETDIDANMTQAEPFRVIVRSIGYGPRGARKELEATIQKNFFNGMGAPATLTLVGPAVNPKNSSDKAVFLPGTSAAMEYSGKDVVSDVIIPPIGTTNDDNLAKVMEEICDCPPKPYNGGIVGFPANVKAEMPFWLESPKNLDDTLKALKLVAQSSGRYFASGQTPPDFGDIAKARGITFVDGDLSLQGDGGGILVVTGKLTLNGKVDFNGLIVVTGKDGLDRKGGGNGMIQGNVVIAPYDPNDLTNFLPPKYDLSGGGTSEVVYNSSSVADGMVAVSNFVLGVAEK